MPLCSSLTDLSSTQILRASLRSSTVSALGAAQTRAAEKLPWACHLGSVFLHAQLSQNPDRGHARRTSTRAFSERCGRSGRSGQEPSGGRGGGGAGRRGAVWAGHGQAQLIQPRGTDLPLLGGCLYNLTRWYPRLSTQWLHDHHKNKLQTTGIPLTLRETEPERSETTGKSRSWGSKG